jgi:type IV secretion system protein VirB11
MPARSDATERRQQMLATAFGPAIRTALKDEAVIEIMVNPDGKLWLDRVGAGRVFSGEALSAADAERIIRLVAAHVRLEAHPGSPIVSAELPGSGERFEGLLPPVTAAPCFSIRKPAGLTYRLSDYVAQGIMGEGEAAQLHQAVIARLNILIAGGTSSGKTTLANALLAEMASLGERVILLEDTRELACAAEDCIALKTKPGVATLADLVRSTLRLRPDRIIIGEVRGREALDLLKAWNTGHPGGIATVHANSAEAALSRLEQLVQEAIPQPSRALIAETIDLIAYLEGRGAERSLKSLVAVTGLDRAGQYRLTPFCEAAHPDGG